MENLSNESIAKYLETLKKNTQKTVTPSKATSAARHKRLKLELCALLEEMSFLKTGRNVLEKLPPQTVIVSMSRLQGDESRLAECIAEVGLINVFSDTLLSPQLPRSVKMEALGHECFHIVHLQMEEDIMRALPGKLNAYDEFFLNLLDEAGAFTGGEQIGAEAGGEESDVSLGNFFFKQTPHYLETYFKKAIMNLKQADITEEEELKAYFSTTHTALFYKIQKAYFDLHPQIKDVDFLSRAHYSFKSFGKTMTDLLTSPDDKINRFMRVLKEQNLTLPELFAIGSAYVEGRSGLSGCPSLPGRSR